MNDNGRADLHVHTRASDGGLAPAQVVEAASKVGLAAIAITDHDTAAGVAEAREAGLRLGVEVVPGVEMKCEFEGEGMEILGYFIRPDADSMRWFSEEMLRRRRERVARMVERLRALGMRIDEADVEREADGGTPGRPHVAAALVRAGYASDMDEPFRGPIGHGGDAYVAIEKPPLTKALEVVRDAGGVPVLAHPGHITGPKDIWRFMEDVAACGVRGVETIYPYGTSGRRARADARNAAEFCRRVERFARDRRLLVTGGSDFHAHDRLAPLGAASVPVEWVRALRRAAGADEP